MNLKIVLFSTLIVAILCTICVEARTRNRKKTVTHHSGSGHNKRGSESGQHIADSTHHRSPDSHPKQRTHKTNTINAENHHIDNSHGPNQHAVNTHTDTSHGPNQAIANHHTDTLHGPNQPVVNTQTDTSHGPNQAIAHQTTDTLHGPNQAIANHNTDTSHIPNQPVYVVHVQQQNAHSSGNDDFEAGYAAGSAAARRMRKRRTTTTTTTVAPKTTTSTTSVPTTTTNQCLTEAPISGAQQYSLPDSYPNQQTHNLYNGEVANPPLAAFQNPNNIVYDSNLQNVHASGYNQNNRDVSNPPTDAWQNPNQPAYLVNLQQQNLHASGNGPIQKLNHPQQQNPVVNCGSISSSTESINILNTSVNNNVLQ
ncbi:putative uncharacterized protein DDB_G0282129 [Calliphora vicina]|uniref:putative uncharacterized protein DDB_G0282129 n=1 Tax=Calliphora vicina TaxID=7373 RepID=UPI00325A5946